MSINTSTRELTTEELAILRDHEKWLDGKGGRRADLTNAVLYGAVLVWADLSGANLSCVNLLGAKLDGANVSCANLCGADLTGARNVPVNK